MTRARRIVVGALAVCTIATLVAPATRDRHGDGLRLLARHESARTRIVGQPPGCAIYFGPHVELWYALQRARWTDDRGNPMRRFPPLSIESEAKLARRAARIEMRDPDRTWNLDRDSFHAVLREYLLERVDPAVAEAAVAVGPPEPVRTWWSARRAAEDPATRDWIYGGALADLAVHLLALLIAGAVLEGAMRARLARPACVILAAAAMAAVLFSLDRAYADSVGFQVLTRPRPRLTSLQRDALEALGIVALWITARVALGRTRGRAVHAWVLAATLALYLGLVCGAAWLQERSIDRMLAIDAITLTPADRAAPGAAAS